MRYALGNCLGIFTTTKTFEVTTMDAAAVTTITSAVDFSTIVTGIGAIAAAIVVVLLAVKGSRMLLGMVRGG